MLENDGDTHAVRYVSAGNICIALPTVWCTGGEVAAGVGCTIFGGSLGYHAKEFVLCLSEETKYLPGTQLSKGGRLASKR